MPKSSVARRSIDFICAEVRMCMKGDTLPRPGRGVSLCGDTSGCTAHSATLSLLQQLQRCGMTNASERVFGHLIFHPRLGFSWVLFSAVAVIAALIAIDTDHPPLAPPAAVPARVQQASPATTTTPPQSTRKSRKRTHKQQPPAVVQPPPNPVPQPKPLVEWKPRSIADISWIAIYAGYIAWSLYWGVPACIWLMIQLLKPAMTSWSSALAG